MKILSFLLMLLLPLSVFAKDTVLVISPFQTAVMAEQTFNHAVTFYSKLELGDTLTVINGSTAHAVATLSVPHNTAYKHPKARLKHARTGLVQIKAFTEQFSQGTRTIGAMDTPHVINHIAINYPQVSDIVLIGSALYDEPTQSGTNMATSLRIPSDAFLASSAIDSQFGTVGRENVLQGKRIHWALTNTSHDSLHSEALKRFWYLFIHAQSGKLVTFVNDFSAVTQRLLNDAQGMSLPYTIKSDGKFEMQGIRRFVPEQTESHQVSIGNGLPAGKSKLPKQQNITVAIEWEGDGVDLDIYAQTHNTKPLYYKNTSNQYGRHFKDILSGSAQAPRKRFETIEFHKGIEPKAWVLGVNVYKSPRRDIPIHGTLHVKIAEKSYIKPIQFDVQNGNHGKDVTSVLSSGISSDYSLYFTMTDVISADSSEVSI